MKINQSVFKKIVGPVCLLVMLALSQSAVAMPTVEFSERVITSQKNDRLSLQVVLSEFPVTQGGGVNIKFNPKKLKVISVEVDKQWSFANKSGVIDNNKGLVSDILFSQFSATSGSVPVATIELEVIGNGKSRVRLSQSTLNPFASDGKTVEVEFNHLTIKSKKMMRNNRDQRSSKQ